MLYEIEKKKRRKVEAYLRILSDVEIKRGKERKMKKRKNVARLREAATDSYVPPSD